VEPGATECLNFVLGQRGAHIVAEGTVGRSFRLTRHLQRLAQLYGLCQRQGPRGIQPCVSVASGAPQRTRRIAAAYDWNPRRTRRHLHGRETEVFSAVAEKSSGPGLMQYFYGFIEPRGPLVERDTEGVELFPQPPRPCPEAN